MATYGTLYLIGFVLAVFILVLWIFLPFAVFGIKNRLDTLIEETHKMTELLADIKNPNRLKT